MEENTEIRLFRATRGIMLGAVIGSLIWVLLGYGLLVVASL